jgi:hypothetical protein
MLEAFMNGKTGIANELVFLPKQERSSIPATCFTIASCHVWSTLVCGDSGFTTCGIPLAVYSSRTALLSLT